jgi:hypothetical protein
LQSMWKTTLVFEENTCWRLGLREFYVECCTSLVVGVGFGTFVGFAIVVFRFIIEYYSSLRDFGP